MEEKQLRKRPDQMRIAAEDRSAHALRSECKIYEIHVRGQLSSRWSEWLDGLEVRLMENGEMILFGPLVDQSALLGILNKLSRLNLTLLAVNEAKRTN